jgi:hypothetical protein
LVRWSNYDTHTMTSIPYGLQNKSASALEVGNSEPLTEVATCEIRRGARSSSSIVAPPWGQFLLHHMRNARVLSCSRCRVFFATGSHEAFVPRRYRPGGARSTCTPCSRRTQSPGKRRTWPLECRLERQNTCMECRMGGALVSRPGATSAHRITLCMQHRT